MSVRRSLSMVGHSAAAVWQGMVWVRSTPGIDSMVSHVTVKYSTVRHSIV